MHPLVQTIKSGFHRIGVGVVAFVVIGKEHFQDGVCIAVHQFFHHLGAIVESIEKGLAFVGRAEAVAQIEHGIIILRWQVFQ